MHFRWLHAFLAGGLVVGALAGCEKKQDPETAESAPREHGLTPDQAEQVLVQIGDTTITVGEFARRLADQSPYVRARYESPERRREFLDNLVRFELLAAEARRRGFDRLPEVERTRKQIMIQTMMRELIEDRIKLSDVTDEEIRAYYEAHPEEFTSPAQVRASHIVVRDRAKAQRLLEQLRTEGADMATFGELAKKHSEDKSTRDRHGDLRFFSRPEERKAGEPDVPDAVAVAAFELPEIGALHPELVRTEAGHHIVLLTGRREAMNRSLDDARRTIQNKLWREKRERAVEDFLAEARKEADVVVDSDALATVRVAIPDRVPAPEAEASPSGPAPSRGNGPATSTSAPARPQAPPPEKASGPTAESQP